jgi:hypothetical protein
LAYLARFPNDGKPPETVHTLFEGGRFCFFFAMDFRLRFGPFGTA